MLVQSCLKKDKKSAIPSQTTGVKVWTGFLALLCHIGTKLYLSRGNRKYFYFFVKFICQCKKTSIFSVQRWFTYVHPYKGTVPFAMKANTFGSYKEERPSV
jgi:hypothetical protein